MSKVIFLDRDGTINVDYGYVSDPDKLEFITGSIQALKRLQQEGYVLIIITNQSGIGRGYFNREAYDRFTTYFLEQLAKFGVSIDRIYMCPHVTEDNCNCRKPKTGLFEQASSDYEIDWENSYAVGDKERDLSICDLKPVKGILLSNQKLSNKRYAIFSNWTDIVNYILKEEI